MQPTTESLINTLSNVSNSDMKHYFDNLKTYKEFHDKETSFQLYSLDANRRLVALENFKEEGVPLVIGKNGLAYLLQTRESLQNEMLEELQQTIAKKNEKEESSNKIIIPNFPLENDHDEYYLLRNTILSSILFCLISIIIYSFKLYSKKMYP